MRQVFHRPTAILPRFLALSWGKHMPRESSPLNRLHCLHETLRSSECFYRSGVPCSTMVSRILFLQCTLSFLKASKLSASVVTTLHPQNDPLARSYEFILCVLFFERHNSHQGQEAAFSRLWETTSAPNCLDHMPPGCLSHLLLTILESRSRHLVLSQ